MTFIAGALSSFAGDALSAIGGFGDISGLISISLPRNIGGIIADVTIEEEGTDEVEITRHPVEQGATISDHAFNQPAVLTMRCGWSNSSFQAFGSLNYAHDTYQALLALKATLTPFSITTGKRVYKNMLFQSLAVTTDMTSEESLMIRATFRELLVAQTQTTSVPPAANQASPQSTGTTQNTGTKQLTPATTFNPSDAYMNG